MCVCLFYSAMFCWERSGWREFAGYFNVLQKDGLGLDFGAIFEIFLNIGKMPVPWKLINKEVYRKNRRSSNRKFRNIGLHWKHENCRNYFPTYFLSLCRLASHDVRRNVQFSSCLLSFSVVLLYSRQFFSLHTPKMPMQNDGIYALERLIVLNYFFQW